ncbi:hypothetical protein Prum_049020 [Phytohabitans rumicis]|uniref:Uncharacterized protein n=1 Tax=Phytohabitans rumicis TaxID=1076125 RepID=A0A6V8L6T7_9ACTN|nr:hypothetical protein Prum_049020 [Phytohabitans rumicis]
MAAAEAQRRAVADFGGVRELAPAYQAELAAGAARRLALRMMLVPALFTALADFMWRGGPWTASASMPPGGYLLVARVQDYLGYAYAVLAVAAYAWLAWRVRRGRAVGRGPARAIAVGTLAMVGVGTAGGWLMYVWSVQMWPAALTWPPMIVGGLVIAATYGWLGRSALTCLAAARARP